MDLELKLAYSDFTTLKYYNQPESQVQVEGYSSDATVHKPNIITVML